MTLKEMWCMLWERNTEHQTVSDALYAFDRLTKLYTQPHRAYHNLTHIQDCLTQLDACGIAPQNPDAVYLALWLHDVIYEIGATDNEEQSAAWASDALTRGNASAELIAAVAELILATKHPSTPQTADAGLVVDIDLSILGRERDVFMRYEQNIREEYKAVPLQQYCRGRAAILQGFLERPSIYLTDGFRGKYEAQARENLRWSIAQLVQQVY